MVEAMEEYPSHFFLNIMNRFNALRVQKRLAPKEFCQQIVHSEERFRPQHIHLLEQSNPTKLILKLFVFC